MSKTSTIVGWTAMAALGVALGLGASPHAQDMWNAATGQEKVKFSAEYVEFTESEMMAEADVIFVGRVRHISDTRWNQDSEQPWKSVGADRNVVALPLHQIEIEVEEKWLDARASTSRRHQAGDGVRVEKGSNTVLTVLGNSPWSFHDHAHHDLRPGDRAVLFARYSDLAWRGRGTKPVLQLIGVPSQAMFIEREQDLFYGHRQPEQPRAIEELQRGVAKSRATVVGS